MNRRWTGERGVRSRYHGCINYFSYFPHKIDKSNLQKQKFMWLIVWAPCTLYHGGGHKAAGGWCSWTCCVPVRKQRGRGCWCSTRFLLSIQFRSPAHGVMPPLQKSLLWGAQQLWKCPHTLTQRSASSSSHVECIDWLCELVKVSFIREQSVQIDVAEDSGGSSRVNKVHPGWVACEGFDGSLDFVYQAMDRCFLSFKHHRTY